MTPLLTKDELLAQTDAIKEQHEHWWREPEAQEKLKRLWGDVINDCGVFINSEEETLFDKDGYKATVSIAEAKGLYAFGVHFSYPLGGHAHAPSISGELFTSRDAARTAAIHRLLHHLPKQLYGHEETHAGKIARYRQRLEGMLSQPSLF